MLQVFDQLILETRALYFVGSVDGTLAVLVSDVLWRSSEEESSYWTTRLQLADRFDSKMERRVTIDVLNRELPQLGP